MKTILSIIIKVVLLCCCAYAVTYVVTRGDFFASEAAEADSTTVSDAADDAGNHLTFKGVPIDGSLKTFVSRMKEKGFKASFFSTDDGQANLTGDFAGYKDCIVRVCTIDGQDIVSGIDVRFPDEDQWEYLEDDYLELKELLTEKYGKPTSCIEKFNSSIAKSSDSNKMLCVKADDCIYETVYETPLGYVTLKIEHDGPLHCFAFLIYSDKVNSATVRERAIEDL